MISEFRENGESVSVLSCFSLNENDPLNSVPPVWDGEGGAPNDSTIDDKSCDKALCICLPLQKYV